jgi:hypothetical protein
MVAIFAGIAAVCLDPAHQVSPFTRQVERRGALVWNPDLEPLGRVDLAAYGAEWFWHFGSIFGEYFSPIDFIEEKGAKSDIFGGASFPLQTIISDIDRPGRRRPNTWDGNGGKGKKAAGADAAYEFGEKIDIVLDTSLDWLDEDVGLDDEEAGHPFAD